MRVHTLFAICSSILISTSGCALSPVTFPPIPLINLYKCSSLFEQLHDATSNLYLNLNHAIGPQFN